MDWIKEWQFLSEPTEGKGLIHVDKEAQDTYHWMTLVLHDSGRRACARIMILMGLLGPGCVAATATAAAATAAATPP